MRLTILFNIIQEGEVIFKKKFRVVLPEVSKLINSGISKRKGDQRKHSFLEKKRIPYNGKRIHYDHPEISHMLMNRAMTQSTHQFYKTVFHIAKCLACNAEKTSQLKITKKMNIAKFVNIYTNIYIYTYIVCNKNYSI